MLTLNENTWNGHHFDVPLILWRAARRRVSYNNWTKWHIAKVRDAGNENISALAQGWRKRAVWGETSVGEHYRRSAFENLERTYHDGFVAGLNA